MTGTALPPASTPTPCSSPPSSSTTWPCRAGAPAAAPAGSKFAPLHWDLPSGKADKGESVTDAAARELKEETGLTVDPATLRVAGIIHGAWGVEAPNGFLTVIFAARSWRGELVNAEPRKHARGAWFPVSGVPAELVPDRRDALIGYLRSPGEPVLSTDGF